jgi:cell division GTPase FtsZ
MKVIGLGGAGCAAVDRMIEAGVEGVAFLAMDTDVEALERSRAGTRLQLGEALTAGLGTDGDAEIGRRAALEGSLKIIRALEGAETVFLIAGMGGGTGTGAAPVVASLAREMGVMTVAPVTTPFVSEGRHRAALAEKGLAELRSCADSVIVIANEAVRAGQRSPADAAPFAAADEMLLRAVRGIADIVTIPGVLRGGFALRKAVDRPQAEPVVKAFEYEEASAETALDGDGADAGLAEFRALLADLSREYAATEEELAGVALEPVRFAAAPPEEAHRPNAQRAAAQAYAAAGVSLPEPEVAPADGPASFAQLLGERLGSIEDVADLSDAVVSAKTGQEPADAATAEPPFGQRFRARRRAMGRGAAVR